MGCLGGRHENFRVSPTIKEITFHVGPVGISC